MKNNKTPGSNGLTPEVLKYEGEELAQEIHRLIVECWKSEKIHQNLAFVDDLAFVPRTVGKRIKENDS